MQLLQYQRPVLQANCLKYGTRVSYPSTSVFYGITSGSTKTFFEWTWKQYAFLRGKNPKIFCHFFHTDGGRGRLRQGRQIGAEPPNGRKYSMSPSQVLPLKIILLVMQLLCIIYIAMMVYVLVSFILGLKNLKYENWTMSS